MPHCTADHSPGQQPAEVLHAYRAARRAFIAGFTAGLHRAGVPALSLWRHTQAAWLADREGLTFGHLIFVLYTVPTYRDPAAPLLVRIACNLFTPGPSRRALARLGLPEHAQPAPWTLELTARIAKLSALASWVAAHALARRDPRHPLGLPPVAMEFAPVPADLRASQLVYLWTRAAAVAYALWAAAGRHGAAR